MRRQTCCRTYYACFCLKESDGSRIEGGDKRQYMTSRGYFLKNREYPVGCDAIVREKLGLLP